MALRRTLHRLWSLIGPLPVTREQAVAIAMAEFARSGRGSDGQLSVRRCRLTWIVVWRTPGMKGGAALVEVDGQTGQVLRVWAGGR